MRSSISDELVLEIAKTLLLLPPSTSQSKMTCLAVSSDPFSRIRVTQLGSNWADLHRKSFVNMRSVVTLLSLLSSLFQPRLSVFWLLASKY